MLGRLPAPEGRWDPSQPWAPGLCVPGVGVEKPLVAQDVGPFPGTGLWAHSHQEVCPPGHGSRGLTTLPDGAPQGLGCGRHPRAGTRKLQGTWKDPYLQG